MATEYTTVILDPRAQAYLRARLEKGPILGPLLVSTRGLGDGIIWTRMPADVDQDSLYEFAVGGKLEGKEVKYGISPHGSIHKMTRIPNMDSDLTAIIRDFLTENADGGVIFEDQLFEPGDACLERAAGRLVFAGDVTFRVVCSDDADPSTVETVIRQARSPELIGVLLESTTFRSEAVRSTIDSAALKEMARNAVKIVISSYDLEGFLIWEPSDADGGTDVSS